VGLKGGQAIAAAHVVQVFDESDNPHEVALPGNGSCTKLETSKPEARHPNRRKIWMRIKIRKRIKSRRKSERMRDASSCSYSLSCSQSSS
jgi:hypothetical protein